jgi:hypothetical protein
MAQDVLVPVSIGELIDKITILRIKERKISDAAKLANIKAELGSLEAVCARAGIDTRSALAAELEAINMKLWQIEDDIRDKERAKAFDAGFVQLARSVYQVNDQRFAVKSKINAETGSTLKEEKSYRDYGNGVF